MNRKFISFVFFDVLISHKCLHQRFFKTVSQSVLIIKACLSYCILVFQDVFHSSTSVDIVVLMRSCFGNFEIDFKIVLATVNIFVILVL